MNGPDTRTDNSKRRTSRQHSRLIALGRLSLTWERLWPCLWQPMGLVGLFLGVALMDVLPLLPLWLHTGLLLGYCVLICVVSTRAFRPYRSPSDADTIHRLERDNHLGGRPVATLHDDMSGGDHDPLTTRLWQEHQLRAAAQSSHMRAALPRPEMARHDPIGLRAIVLLVMLIGITIGYDDPGLRLARALSPSLNWHGTTMRADVWVNPPAYTGHTPFHLSAAKLPGAPEVEPKTYEIPVGSDILVQVGSDAPPNLMLGARQVSFEPIGTGGTGGTGCTGGYRADTQVGVSDASQLTTSLTVSVRGAETTQWPIHIIDDTPPVVDFIEEPSAGTRGRLKISFAARDDYNLRDVELIIQNLALPQGGEEETVMQLALPMPRRNANSVSTSVVRDLSQHEWAGVRVAISLEARDAIGQIGRSGTITMILPERPFNHPVAQKLIKFRKMLDEPTDDIIETVIKGIHEVSITPSAYNNDTIAFLVMRVSRSRLWHRSNDGDISSVRRMLWETALRIEDGEFAIAGRELSDAHDQLMEALQDGANGELVSQLLDTLREALDRFMTALNEQLAKKGLDSVTDLPGMSYMDNTDILSMLEDARELARTGSMDAARQTLDDLRALLENIEAAMNSDVSMEQYNAARETLEKLFNLTQKQESLLDDTFRQVRRAQDPRNSDLGQPLKGVDDFNNPYEGPAITQEAIRETLRKLMPQLQGNAPKIPAPAIQAERAMQRSTQALSSAKGGESIPYQSDALDALRRTSELLAQQMAEQLQGMPGTMASPRGMLPNGGDPFGRVGNGGLGSRMDDRSVTVPDQIDVQRAQEIFNELRDRAGDLDRPEVERNYIKRLLQPF
ncbi:MAG: TIGR02302 family protein [Rhodospirillales bacterium]|nr:TIGR02302 family protein [Rhodospirillales bacterium]MBT4039024.1 TIGR02302 family protein [Rhodospirillales bacterium]MBT4628054.1 TIGR02302 family protein [Rhodospirillales bacterium]MBT5352570.1 TIGR02302 family protein [Rhodospirillales bacterium]MBT5520900.1 TIGR02302 family protein [Rhodospirillales bacterium]